MKHSYGFHIADIPASNRLNDSPPVALQSPPALPTPSPPDREKRGLHPIIRGDTFAGNVSCD